MKDLQDLQEVLFYQCLEYNLGLVLFLLKLKRLMNIAAVLTAMSLNTSRIEELKGLLLTVLHPSFISVLTNSYYGGEISVTPNQRTEFTATEERVIEIISSGLNDALEVSWRDLMPINLREQGEKLILNSHLL